MLLYVSVLKVALVSLPLDILKVGTCVLPSGFQLNSKTELQRLLAIWKVLVFLRVNAKLNLA